METNPDSPEHQEDAPSSSSQPKTWTRVLPKKKRSHTRTLYRKTSSSVQQAAAPSEPSPPNPPTIETTRAARKPSNAELNLQLKRKDQELSQANEQVASKTKQVESLRKKNESLTAATHKARYDLREYKSAAKQSDLVAQKEISQLEYLKQSADSRADAIYAAKYEAQLKKEVVSSLQIVPVKCNLHPLPFCVTS